MRTILKLSMAALPLLLAACGGGGDDAPPPPTNPPPPLAAAYNVQTCLDQEVRPGMTVANVVVPDTIKLDLSQPTSFPNGRHPADSAIDRTIAMLFIDVPRHGIDALARLPLGPQANETGFRAEFPYLAAPNGTQPPPGQGSNFNFRTDPVSAYVQVDRMANPAVATVLIGTSQKNPYNDDSPAVDGTRKYVNELATQLTGLTNALADDFINRGLTLCARPAA